MAPQDERLCLGHLADGALEFDGAARLVELFEHAGPALVDDLHHGGWRGTRGGEREIYFRCARLRSVFFSLFFLVSVIFRESDKLTVYFYIRIICTQYAIIQFLKSL